MKHRLRRIGLFAVFALLLSQNLLAQTDSLRNKYTDAHPLIYEDAWDLWPYAYLNDRGEPMGFNVDLVRMICKELDIPVVIRLRAVGDAINDLVEGRSDLMLGLDNRYRNTSLICSKSIVQLFTHSMVCPKKQPIGVKTLEDLSRQQVIVHKGSFCHDLMVRNGWLKNAEVIGDMKAALLSMSAKEEGQMVWNTMSLKWLMRTLQTDNLQMVSVDMPYGVYRFRGRDSLLMACIDDVYVELSSSRSELEAMQNRWFYPELVETGIPAWVWYLTGGVVVIALLLLLLYLFYRRREQVMMARSMQNTRLLSQILQQSNMRIWIYDLLSHTYQLMDAKGDVQEKYTTPEFCRPASQNDFDLLFGGLRRIESMETERVSFIMRAKDDNDRGEEREFKVVLSVLRMEKNRPSVILGTMSDVTEERKRQLKTKTLLVRYKSIFETAMVDMVYYNKEGYLANMNKRAMRTFNMDLEMARSLKIHLKDVIKDAGFNPNTFDFYHATRSMKEGNNPFLPDAMRSKSRSYYELQLVAVRDDWHQLQGVFGTGRDVTEFVNNWRQQKENIKQLREGNKEVENYVRNIDYVMKVGGVRMANYSPQTHMLTIYRETDVVQYQLTQSRCMALLAETSKKKVLRVMDQMDNLAEQTTEIEIQTIIRKEGMPVYLQINMVPIYDEEGHVNNYFGMLRDVSDMKGTELKLVKETARAREVEVLKNSFLRNMSYEIRTPLNTVVGFAELFEQEHLVEDETVFVNEIKNSASYLLRLINDILFLSRLDAHMIEINRQPTDFAKTFEARCHTGWDSLKREGVNYITNNHYEQLVVNIDDANIGYVISQIAANAAQHTESGTVRARYDYYDGRLMIIIEDTGCGISEEDMKHIYERFNSSGKHGTGLGLPICKELVKQMGGNLDIISKVGKGTTVWIIIPCEATAMERKIEI